jgi:hypothetical protein
VIIVPTKMRIIPAIAGTMMADVSRSSLKRISVAGGLGL